MSIGPWDFNYIDIVVLIVVFISLFMAMSRGFFRELMSIIALVVGAAVSLYVFGRFRADAREFFKPEQLADIVLGAGTFFVTYMLVVFILGMFSKSGKDKGLSFFDRLLGGGFGALRGLIVCSLAIMFFNGSYYDGMGEYQGKLNSYDEIIKEGEEAKDILSDTNVTDARIIRDYQERIRRAESTPAPSEPELPEQFANSTLFPILDKITVPLRAVIRKAKRAGEKLYEGDPEGAIEEL